MGIIVSFAQQWFKEQNEGGKVASRENHGHQEIEHQSWKLADFKD